MFFILVCVQPVSGAEHLKNVSNNSMSRKECAERLTLTPRRGPPSIHPRTPKITFRKWNWKWSRLEALCLHTNKILNYKCECIVSMCSYNKCTCKARQMANMGIPDNYAGVLYRLKNIRRARFRIAWEARMYLLVAVASQMTVRTSFFSGTSVKHKLLDACKIYSKYLWYSA